MSSLAIGYLSDGTDNNLGPRLGPIAGSIFNVRDPAYGATGDGVTDDSVAVRAAIRAAVGAGAGGTVAGVFFPPGNYRLASGAVLSDINATSKTGLKLFGAHHRASQITLDTTGASADMWFYDNGTTATPRLQYMTFEDLHFIGTGSWANGFRFDSSGWEQAPHFTNCRFSVLKQVFDAEGTGNADRTVWTACHFSNITDAVLYLNNSQSVAHAFLACDFAINGDFVRVGTGGGGDVQVFGGSMVLNASDTTARALVNVPDGSNVGDGNGTFAFHGVKTELNSQYKALVSHYSRSGVAAVHFHRCNLASTLGGTRNSVDITAGKLVTFSGCRVSASHGMRVRAQLNDDQVWSNVGTILFDDCELSSAIQSAVTLDNGVGVVQARRCLNTAGTVTPGRVAIDFTVGWAKSAEGQSWPTHRAALMKASEAFPYAGTNEYTLLLPPSATIRRIRVYRPSGAGAATAYRLLVGTDDKSVVHGTSLTANQSAGAVIDVEPWYLTGTDTTSRTVRLWSDNGSGSADSGIANIFAGAHAFVEYF